MAEVVLGNRYVVINSHIKLTARQLNPPTNVLCEGYHTPNTRKEDISHLATT
jgi:hypothetical protein